MENLFRQNEISVNLDVMERANPIFNTAKTTIYLLAESGNDDAKLLASALGLTFDRTQNSDTNKTTADTFITTMIVIETRYRTMNRLAEKSCCDADIDLPCGYAPRALSYARMGKRFAGLDIPAVIQEVRPKIMRLIGGGGRDFVRLEAVDATNYDSLAKALEGIRGTLCIMTEGLLMYFTDSELTAITENIRKILSEHGGWLNAYSLLKPEQVTAVKEAMTHAACWKMTLAEKTETSRAPSAGKNSALTQK